jgi:tRNA threonylcarbamoyladenosine biosynthesis protein TsaE
MTGAYEIGSADEMQVLGKRIARELQRGDVLMLHGDLGAGKTTLTQGIAAGLGVEGPVQSPTFTLVREHRGTDLMLYHLDLYRLVDPDELENLGYETYLDPVDGVSIIEWPERAVDWLPEAFTLVRIDHMGGDRRRVTIERIGGEEME